VPAGKKTSTPTKTTPSKNLVIAPKNNLSDKKPSLSIFYALLLYHKKICFSIGLSIFKKQQTLYNEKQKHQYQSINFSC
jgi:hypothetical protein